MGRANYNTPAFKAARNNIRAMQDAGTTLTCRRCGQPIPPWQRADTGHPDPGQHGYAPEHPACNRSAGITAENQDRATRGHPLAL